MLIFLDNLPDLEKQCKKGGWIPDDNLKPCKSGDRIRLLDGIYSNWIAELYWNYKEKAFYYKPISVYGVVSNSFYKQLMLSNTRFIKYEK